MGGAFERGKGAASGSARENGKRGSKPAPFRPERDAAPDISLPRRACHPSDTNTMESAFSLLKKGIYGTFHKVSIKHLPALLR